MNRTAIKYKIGNIITFTEMTQICGYFECETDANNGYGCLHRQSDEYDEHKTYDGRKVGRCFTWCCPFSGEICMDDFTSDEDKELNRQALIANGLDPDDECYKQECEYVEIVKLSKYMKEIK